MSRPVEFLAISAPLLVLAAAAYLWARVLARGLHRVSRKRSGPATRRVTAAATSLAVGVGAFVVSIYGVRVGEDPTDAQIRAASRLSGQLSAAGGLLTIAALPLTAAGLRHAWRWPDGLDHPTDGLRPPADISPPAPTTE